MASQAARHAAYAELVAGLLDVRDPAAEERFDRRLDELVAQGLVDPDGARSLRLLQRQSVRALVEHAQTVLPATLLAIENSHREQSANDVDDQPSFAESVRDAETASASDAMADQADEEIDLLEPPADLTARRLLVAGLTQLPEP